MASETGAAAPPGASADRGSQSEVGGWTLSSTYTLGFLIVIYALNLADRNIFGLLMPLIKADMQLSDTMLGLMSGFAFALFYALAGVPVAYLADRWNRRTIITIGFAIWSMMTVLMGMVQNAVQLALTRFMLGAGEAACLAPSNSIIGDLFNKAHRTLALSILQGSNSLSILVAFPIFGWVAQHHGWRIAFILAGAPGLVLALLFFLTVKEPKRGQTDAAGPEPAPQVEKAAPFLATMGRLVRTRSYVLAILATTLTGISVMGVQTWLPTLLMRVHDLPPQEVGAYVGFIRGPAGVAGAIFGGLLTTWLARRDSRWLVWTPALFMACVFVSDMIMLYVDSSVAWKIGMAADTFFGSGQVGPIFGILLASADARSRATATAVAMLLLHIVGFTIGPLAIGVLNDILGPTLGPEAIRTSITIVAFSAIAGAICCFSIGRLESPAAPART
ncbi:MAG: MFS transporter [Hyphomonadaceae bacterium]|nr:MFS transporter [Hyphomonadaceae bacterium]